MAYALASINLGTVTSEKPKGEANLDIMSTSMEDSSGTWAMDNNGVTRDIIVKGEVTAADANALSTIVKALYALQNGMQDAIDYTSDMLGTIKVKVKTVDGEYKPGEPLSFEYIITIVECDTAI